MQKQSFELIKNYGKIGQYSLIRYNSRYPIVLFFICVIPWIIIRLIREPDIDLIHGNDGLMGLFLTPFLLLRRKKILVTIHGLDIVFNFQPYQWWVRTLLARFDGIIAVSQQTQEECLKRGIPATRITYIPNAVELPKVQKRDPGFAKWVYEHYGVNLSDRINPDRVTPDRVNPDRVTLTSVGRAIPRKGFSWFVKNVLPHLPEQVVYFIIGPQERKESFYDLLSKILPKSLFRKFCQMNGIAVDYFELKKAIEDPLVRDRVRLTGKLSHDHLTQMYLHTDIFVMPNLRVAGDYEGFGLVAQEAVLHGALCIASNIDGIPSAIRHEETGILLPEGDAGAWVDTIRKKVLDMGQTHQQALRFQANLQADNYSCLDMARAYFHQFGKVMDHAQTQTL